MKNFLIISVCAVLLCFSTIAKSADGSYVSGNLGIVVASDSDHKNPSFPGGKLDIESDTGFALAGAVGYKSGEVRGEIEVAYQKNDLDKASSLNSSGDITSLSVLLNGYYDIATNSEFTPFISAGLGFAKIDLNDFNFTGSGLPDADEDDTVFAYQVGAGVGYAVDEQVSLEIKYRYFATTDPEFAVTDAEYSSHNFLAGVRFGF